VIPKRGVEANPRHLPPMDVFKSMVEWSPKNDEEWPMRFVLLGEYYDTFQVLIVLGIYCSVDFVI